MFLTRTQLNKLREKVEKNMSTDIKLSKEQLNKLIEEGGSLEGAYFIRKNILAPLGLSAAMSATDAAIQKKVHGYGTKTVRFLIKI